MTDPNLHAACNRALEQATADYMHAVRAIDQQAGTDARIGLAVRLLLGDPRWNMIRREELQAMVDQHMGVPGGVDR